MSNTYDFFWKELGQQGIFLASFTAISYIELPVLPRRSTNSSVLITRDRQTDR